MTGYTTLEHIFTLKAIIEKDVDHRKQKGIGVPKKMQWGIYALYYRWQQIDR